MIESQNIKIKASGFTLLEGSQDLCNLGLWSAATKKGKLSQFPNENACTLVLPPSNLFVPFIEFFRNAANSKEENSRHKMSNIQLNFVQNPHPTRYYYAYHGKESLEETVPNSDQGRGEGEGCQMVFFIPIRSQNGEKNDYFFL